MATVPYRATTRVTPSISVVIPLYNKAAYVVEAVRSVLAQSHAAMEVLVIDDGSTDDGAARVRALGESRVRLVSQPNGGVSVARNHGIRLARGELVAFLDADDRWQPDFLATVVALAARFPAAGLLCTGYARVDAAGRRAVVGHPRIPPGDSGLVVDFHGDWSLRSFTFTSAIAVHRRLLMAMAQPFAPGERLGEDQDLWFRLAEAGDVAYCNRALVDYRVEVAGSATRAHPLQDVLPCYQRLAERLARGEVPVAQRAGARRLLACHLINLARQHGCAGRRAQAVALLRDPRARGNLPYWLRSVVWLAVRRHGGEAQ